MGPAWVLSAHAGPHAGPHVGPMKPINPSDAEAGMLLTNHVNTMSADALAACGAMTPMAPFTNMVSL